MADKTVRLWDPETNTPVDVLYKDNGDGTHSQAANTGGGLDSTDKLKTSVYGKNSVAGDQALALDNQGAVRALLQIGPNNGNVFGYFYNNADDMTPAPHYGLITIANPFLFNGTAWDRQRGNMNATVLASAVRATTTNSADQTNYNGRGLKLYMNITAVPGTDTVTVTIKGKDPVSGSYASILASAALDATGLTVLSVYPGIAASANAAASDVLPRTWRVEVTHSASGSFTYSVGASVLL